MIQYPTTFVATSNATSLIEEPWKVSGSGFDVECAIPPEFDGPGGALSPEDYFLLALTNCFVATFKVYANASRLNFAKIDAESKLIIDRLEDKRVIANECLISVRLEGIDNPERARTLLDKVSRSGILLNSVKTRLEFNYSINGETVV